MRRGGFTLLEVLAAVAVLALSYTVLAGTAMQGLANEGESHRRLRASLLADLQIGEIESALAAAAPPVGVTETELEDYVISVESRPFDLGAFALAGRVEGAPGSAAGGEGAAVPPGGTAPGGAGAPGSGPPFQLLTAAPGAPSPLYEVIVRVSWMEGGYEREVTRTTFAADPVAVQQAVASLGGAGEDGAAPQDGDAPAADPNAMEPEE